MAFPFRAVRFRPQSTHSSDRFTSQWSKNSKRASRTARRAWYCVVPQDHWMLARWDMCGSLLLCLVCVLTPLEAGFLPCAEAWSTRSVINSIVTFFFFCDIVLQFFLPFTEHTKSGFRIQRRKPAIVKNYFMTWFALDLISVFPFGVIFPCTRGTVRVDLGVVRTIRLLRLLKLLRLLRGLRILNRWQTEFGYSLRKSMLYTITVAVIVATHWMACALGLISRFQGQACSPAQTLESVATNSPHDCTVTWLSVAAAIRHDHSSERAPPDEISFSVAYTIALHASMSILVHPHSYHPPGLIEQGCFIFLLLVGGFVWTQVISRTTAIRTSLSRHENQHQTTMDDLNATMASLSLSSQLRRRQRKFFLHTRDVVKQATWMALVKQMSPKLCRDLNREMRKGWVRNIRCLGKCPIGIISDVSQRLFMLAFSEAEIFGEMWHLYIVKTGSIMNCQGKVMSTNGVWGEDHMLLSCGDLVSDTTATALIFVQCHALSRPSFQEVIHQYPDHYDHFRRKTVKLAVFRGVRLQAERLRQQRQHEASTTTSTSLRSELDEATKDALCLVRSRMANRARDWMQPPTPSATVLPSDVATTVIAPERTPEPELDGSMCVAQGGSKANLSGMPHAHASSFCTVLSPVPLATLALLSQTVDRVAEEQRALAHFVDQQLTAMEQNIRSLTGNAAPVAQHAVLSESGEFLSTEARHRDADAVYF